MLYRFCQNKAKKKNKIILQIFKIRSLLRLKVNKNIEVFLKFLEHFNFSLILIYYPINKTLVKQLSTQNQNYPTENINTSKTKIRLAQELQISQWFRNCPVAIFRAYRNGEVIVLNKHCAKVFFTDSEHSIDLTQFNLNEYWDFDKSVKSNIRKSNIVLTTAANEKFEAELTLYELEEEDGVYEGFIDTIKGSQNPEELVNDYEYIQHLGKIVPFWYDAVLGEMTWGKEAFVLFKHLFPKITSLNDYLEFIHPDDRRRFKSAFYKSIKLKESDAAVSYRIFDAEGEEKVILCKLIHTYDSAGNLKKIKGWVQDITDISNVKTSLNDQENIFQTMLSTVPVAIYKKNRWLEYEMGNDQFLKDAGISNLNDLIGKTDLDLPWGKDAAELMQADDMDIIENLEPQLNFENIIETADGETRAIRVRKVPIVNSDNTCTGILGAYVDVTKEKIDQQKLLDAYDSVKRSDDLKGKFLANMSKEIRTPLGAIVSFADMLSRDELSKTEIAEFTQLVQLNADRLSKVVSDILDLSLIDSKQLKLNIQTISLETLLQEQYTSLKRRLRLVNSDHIEVKLSLPINEGCVVQCDKVRIRQVLNNLLDNAIKFTEIGCIEMGLMYTNKQAVVFVKDTGMGVNHKEMPKLFDRFYTSSNHSDGLGVGLSLAKELLELMNGKIWIEPNTNEGSAFFFSLPSYC